MNDVADKPSAAAEADDPRKEHDQPTSLTATDTLSQETDDQPTTRRRFGQYGLEAAIGIVLAVVVLYVAWASSGEVPFVYEGY